jgi:hypothetical protein
MLALNINIRLRKISALQYETKYACCICQLAVDFDTCNFLSYTASWDTRTLVI